jgi:glycine cleavage system H protein
MEKFGEIESVKAVSDLYSPVSGEVVGRNERLVERPELVNQSPYQSGWLFQLECSDVKEWDSLLTEAQYNGVKGASH